MLNYKRPFRALGLVVVVLFSFAVTSRTIGTDDCQAKNIIPKKENKHLSKGETTQEEETLMAEEVSNNQPQIIQ